MVLGQGNCCLATIKGNHLNRLGKLSRAFTLAASAVLIIATTGTALASDEPDVQSLVEKWVADMNKGDLKSAVAACAPQTAVVDGFPPYAWPTCADWMKDYQKNSEATHAPLGTVSIGGPKYREFSGNRAYLIYPVTFSNTQSGKPVAYKGIWTITLRRAKGGWEITGSASAFSENDL
jgi:ketosteroid isomerase-like protein